MTTKEKLESMLVGYGMFESQAKQVIELAIPDIEKQSPGNYKITWDQPASGYPEMIYSLWFLVVKKVALPWIDKNCPNAWFRPMFDDKQLVEIKSQMRTVAQNEELMKERVIHSAHMHIEDPSTKESYAVHVAVTRPKKRKKVQTLFSYHKGYAIVNGIKRTAKTQI